jgi:hypothetical protein
MAVKMRIEPPKICQTLGIGYRSVTLSRTAARRWRMTGMLTPRKGTHPGLGFMGSARGHAQTRQSCRRSKVHPQEHRKTLEIRIPKLEVVKHNNFARAHHVRRSPAQAPHTKNTAESRPDKPEDGHHRPF